MKDSVIWRKNEPGCLEMTFAIALLIALVVALHALVSVIALFAWNIAVPAVFGGPVLDYAQAFWGLALIRILIAPLTFRSTKE